jgi:ATP-binding cassette subfamily F protein uup
MTLQVLEDFLVDFKGCLLIVSHDRYFLDKLTEHLFVFEGDGKLRDFNGNYNEYREWLKEQERQRKIDEKAALVASASSGNASKIATQKLSYKEKRELEQLEQEMAALEAEKIQVAESLLQPEADHQQLTALGQRMEEITAALDEKELRWLELSEKEG